MGNNLVERGRSHSAVTSDADAVKEALELEDIMNLLMEDSESSKHFFQGEMTKRISTQSHAVKHREDHVMSQVLSGLAESFLIKIYLYAKNKDGVDWRWSHMFEIFSECGYLYELESLLSTRGNEQGTSCLEALLLFHSAARADASAIECESGMETRTS